ncbi:MAG: HAMP domain-containing protein [Chloroflexales bacterium]|nr:HAMP domain-containing protein [Chloroflexales bacterium]
MKHPQPLTRLRVQLLWAALLPVLLVSVLLTWPVVELRRSQLLEQARMRTLQAGRSSELLIAERLGFAELLASLLADRPALTRALAAGDRDGVTAFVRETRGTTLFDLVTVVGPQGGIVAQDGAAELWRPDGDPERASWVWGRPGVGLVAQVATPILIDGARQGTLIGAFALGESFVSAARQRTGLDQGLLVGEQLVASSLSHRLTAGAGRLFPADAQAGSGGTTARETTIGGVPYLVHYQPVHSHADEQLATIELLLPLAPVRAAQRQTTLAIFGGVLLAIGIAALLSWLLARRITGSIRTLSNVARRIGAGDLTAPVQVDGAAEIVHLSTAVDQMRQQLAASHAALAAETARYLSILETTDEAILVLDADGRVTLANRGAEALLGCARTRVAGVLLSEVVTLHGGAPLTLADIPPVGSVHLAIQTADGGIRTVAATRAAVLTDAEAARGEQLVVLRDVSETVALSQLKDAFLANVTHEFRTPLAALIASLELLRNEHGDLSPAEQQPLLEAVHVGVRRLDTLVQNLLDSASIQAGYFRVVPEVTWLAPLIDEAVELMLPLVRQRAQTIRVVLAPELPPILADDRRIVQVLVNLLSNASKFGPRGDTIVLAAQARQGQMIVAVSDHGPGILGSRGDALFERFLRPGGQTHGAQGAGLGLAIVKAIVERHGGAITVDTDAEAGTTFRFTLQVSAIVRPLQNEHVYEHSAG